MKKQFWVLLLFFVYAVSLLLLAVHYQVREENFISTNFFRGFGEIIGAIYRYALAAFLASSAFLILAYFIDDHLSPAFILLAPFLNIVVAFAIWAVLDFILWITRLRESVDIFQKIFIIASVSTLATTFWLLGHLFKSEGKK